MLPTDKDGRPSFPELLISIGKCAVLPIALFVVSLFVLMAFGTDLYRLSAGDIYGQVIGLSAGAAALFFRLLWNDYFRP